MRSFVMMSFALAVALAPRAASAQQPPAQQPPAQQPPATTAPAQPPAAPTAPKLTFTTTSGVLLVQVKPDQTAAFEEMVGKIKTGVGNSSDPDVKAQAGAWKAYKASEPMGGNTLYVVVIDPVKPGGEYNFLDVLNKTLTDEQKRDPATQDMYKRYAAAIAGVNKLNVSPAGGGM